ncbi:hypothetical protein ALC53_10962 [Atta colombica]|uniref:Uncharacterized protein n=1 Tax=Atta colombica TaxID=520822 RepID=A0A195B1Z1_9HYME|nr:hypothetical protein ALC53_10962 [Atta colombica]
MSKLKKKRNQNVLIYFLLLHSIAEIITYLALAIVTRQLSYLCRETKETHSLAHMDIRKRANIYNHVIRANKSNEGRARDLICR